MNLAEHDNKRLAVVTDYLVSGGASVFIRNLALGLAEIGARGPIDVIVLEQCDAKFVATIKNANIHALDKEMASAIREDRLLEAYRILSRNPPSGIIASIGMWSFELLRYLPPGVTRIGMIQSDDPAVYRMVAKYKEHLDYLVGVSPEICRRTKIDFDLDESKVLCIPYGVPESIIPRKAREAGGVINLIYLGRLIEEQKRVSRLVDLVEILESGHVSYQLKIVGDGPARSFLESKFRKHGSVEIYGEVNQGKVYELLAESDYLLLLSDYEGMPLSIIEGMMLGVNPILNRIPSLEGWINKEDCYFVDVADPNWKTDVVNLLYSSAPRTIAKTQAMMTWAKKTFSLQQMCKAYLTLVPAIGVTFPILSTIEHRPIAVSNQRLFCNILRPLRRLLKQWKTEVSLKL